MGLLSDTFTQKFVDSHQEAPPGKILIVTSCTKDKILPSGLSYQDILMPKDLWDDEEDSRVARNFGHLEEYRKPAGELYRGRQHYLLMQAVSLLRQSFGESVVDIKIISAGFGVVDEKQPLPPYNATFADLSSSKIAPLARKLGIPQAMNALMQENYDCAFFLLGESYLLSLGVPFPTLPSFPCLFLAGPSSRKCIPRRAPYRFIRVGQDDSIAFSCNLISLKGYLLKLFAEQIIAPQASTPPDIFRPDMTKAERLKTFLANPTRENFSSIVKPFFQKERISQSQAKRIANQLATQVTLFDIKKSTEWPEARNVGRQMRYFIPDWDDLVDPGYDFVKDMGTPGKRKYVDEFYAHEIYKGPNYDGLLFSKSTVEDGQTKRDLINSVGIHNYARFDKPILGDCGAFSYVFDEEPPYNTREILEYYQRLGFDYGVSIDHLIIPAVMEQKEFRYQLTRKNAQDFFELHKAGGYKFTPVGVAQGWSPETYRDAVAELLEIGYQFVALGGLARARTEEIYEIMREVGPLLKENTDLHLFGVARDRDGDEMKILRQMGVTSFDSATYLRRAWMSANTNYFTEDGGRYAALRISPVYESSPRVRKLIAEEITTVEKLKKLEQDALRVVREYDRGQLDLETTLDVLLEIDRLEEFNYEQHLALYRKVLEDQPWKKCSCEICRALGVEVIIFRSNDRNRRRGFHNTYVFYKRFRELVGK